VTVSDHRHDPRDAEAEPCCPECCDCTEPGSLDAHMLDCDACREADEPCAIGEHLFAVENAL
jgi:hypothetical protein